MEVDNDGQQLLVWRLEHHKKFVDIVVRLGGFNKIGTPGMVVREMMNDVKGLSQRTVVHHMVWFQQLNKRTQSSLRAKPCADSFQSLLRDFESLHVTKRLSLSSWTVEHHRQVLEAVTKLGGIDKATPTAILRLMKEERRQGLTVRTVSRHLSRLRDLQKKTQKIIIDSSQGKSLGT